MYATGKDFLPHPSTTLIADGNTSVTFDVEAVNNAHISSLPGRFTFQTRPARKLFFDSGFIKCLVY